MGVKTARVAAEEGKVTTTELRCPECGSLVRAGVSWCSLCHADVRSDEEKEAARLEAEQLASAGIPRRQADARSTRRPTRSSSLRRPAGAPRRLPSAVPPSTPTRSVAALTPDEAGPDSAETSAETEEKLAELRQAGVDVDGMLQMLAVEQRRPTR